MKRALLLVALLLVAGLATTPSAEAAAILQVTAAASPAKISPGSSGVVTLAVKNAGNVSAVTLETTIDDADNGLEIAQKGPIALGGIGALESTTFTPFTYTVARNATPGVYRIDATMTFRYFETGTTHYNHVSYSVPVVVTAPANLVIKGVSPDSIEPGTDIAGTIRLANTGPAEYINIAGSWSSPENHILPLGGSNQFQLASIAPNAEVEIPVRWAASTGAAPGLYALTFELRYSDLAGNAHNSTSNIGIWLSSATTSELNVNIQNITDDEITLALTNVGLKPLTGVQVRLVPVEGFVLEDSDTIVVGNVLPGEFQTATFDIKRTATSATARADVSYTDSLGQRRSGSEPLTLTEETIASGPSGAVVGVVTAVVLLVAQGIIMAIWIAHRRVKNKQAAKESKEEADFAALAQAARQDTDDLQR